MIGNVSIFTEVGTVPDRAFLEQCYLAKHPDAKWWLPNDDEAGHIVSTILWDIEYMGS